MADVYIAGILFYELLSGQRLGQLPEREILHASALRKVIQELDPEPEIATLLRAMLDFRPKARLELGLLCDELDGLIAREPGALAAFMCWEPSGLGGLDAVRAPEDSAPGAPVTPWKALPVWGGPDRARLLIIVGASMVLALCCGVTGLATLLFISM